VYLVHGTFVGPDTLGLAAALGRRFPAAGRWLGRRVKRAIDRLIDETGNYTLGFARLLDSALNRTPGPRIAVRRFCWSSENHHLGRADGAVRLLDDLASRQLGPGRRVLLWGHSHGGNLLAIVSNLLGGGPEAVENFFHAAQVYYRSPRGGRVEIPMWQRVRELLERRGWPQGVGLDMVTFGTPVRYGWDSGGYGRLLHFVYHRPVEGLPAHRAAFPPKVRRLVRGADGDYTQQLGIAGTNFMPIPLAWRAWLADRRLHRLLQGHGLEGNRWAWLRSGRIVPDEGTTLLVDYGLPRGGLGRHLAGHAVYTRREWLLFHAEQVVERFYSGAT